MNQETASDGEAFAEGARRLGLGTLIGTRTWGGEIWLSANAFAVSDGGIASNGQNGVYDLDGKSWLIEGKGVVPDVKVDNVSVCSSKTPATSRCQHRTTPMFLPPFLCTDCPRPQTFARPTKQTSYQERRMARKAATRNSKRRWSICSS